LPVPGGLADTLDQPGQIAIGLDQARVETRARLGRRRPRRDDARQGGRRAFGRVRQGLGEPGRPGRGRRDRGRRLREALGQGFGHPGPRLRRMPREGGAPDAAAHAGGRRADLDDEAHPAQQGAVEGARPVGRPDDRRRSLLDQPVEEAFRSHDHLRLAGRGAPALQEIFHLLEEQRRIPAATRQALGQDKTADAVLPARLLAVRRGLADRMQGQSGLRRDQARQLRLADPGRSVQQHVHARLAAASGRPQERDGQLHIPGQVGEIGPVQAGIQAQAQQVVLDIAAGVARTRQRLAHRQHGLETQHPVGLGHHQPGLAQRAMGETAGLLRGDPGELRQGAPAIRAAPAAQIVGEVEEVVIDIGAHQPVERQPAPTGQVQHLCEAGRIGRQVVWLGVGGGRGGLRRALGQLAPHGLGRPIAARAFLGRVDRRGQADRFGPQEAGAARPVRQRLAARGFAIKRLDQAHQGLRRAQGGKAGHVSFSRAPFVSFPRPAGCRTQARLASPETVFRRLGLQGIWGLAATARRPAFALRGWCEMVARAAATLAHEIALVHAGLLGCYGMGVFPPSGRGLSRRAGARVKRKAAELSPLSRSVFD
jgi:hypothetical protein